MRSATLAFVFLASPALHAQVGVDISMERSSFLLYEEIEAQVKLSNYLSEPLDMARMSGGGPWLSFYVTTAEEEEIAAGERAWTPPRVALLPGQMKSVSVNLTPYFLIRDPGEYRVAALVIHGGKRVSSRALKFSVVNGVTIWQQRYTAPAEPGDASRKPRPRLYSLLMHRINQLQTIYARIQNPEANFICCTTLLGNIVNYGEPRARVDLRGDLHVLHQSGTRIYNYTRFSAVGKRLENRFFANLTSPPIMVTGQNDETEIIGGEEIFQERDQKQQVIPTAPIAKTPRH
ncbi:MAG: hypothetical protein HY360_13295 [Verrucomicrobia bacterium]|nr:hypothetical protein [Verrucomicrobiota bacterium]